MKYLKQAKPNQGWSAILAPKKPMGFLPFPSLFPGSHLQLCVKLSLLFLKVKTNSLFVIGTKALEFIATIGKASCGLQDGYLKNKLYGTSDHKK